MIRRRSVSGIEAHRAISLRLRPQPMHSFDRGSIVQTLVQGELIGDIAANSGKNQLRFAGEDRHSGRQ
jgi:hypothetical protein